MGTILYIRGSASAGGPVDDRTVEFETKVNELKTKAWSTTITLVMATSFRRINVDQYDEENLILPNDLVPENTLSDQELLDMVQAASQEARSFLQRGDTQMALAAVLSVQPYGSSPALTNAKVRSSKLD
jgi:hypothetical protein